MFLARSGSVYEIPNPDMDVRYVIYIPPEQNIIVRFRNTLLYVTGQKKEDMKEHYKALHIYIYIYISFEF